MDVSWGGLTVLVYCVGLSTVMMGSLRSSHLVWFRLLCFRVYVGGHGCVVCFFLATDAWETRSRVIVAVQGAPPFVRAFFVFEFGMYHVIYLPSRPDHLYPTKSSMIYFCTIQSPSFSSLFL